MVVDPALRIPPVTRPQHYRPEIDGLRAMAVLPVILYHGGFTWFSGGYVGVDVFFVISGFLITSIILEERISGSFSLVRFYERRARRILPALFVVLLACLPLAWFRMLPQEFESFGQSVVAVALFVSNTLFWLTSGYFDLAAAEKPLLHTWSLGVEEQYYLAFPLLIALLWRLGIRSLGILLAVLALASFVLSEWALHRNPVASFFLAPMRGWELFAGGALAFASYSRAAGWKAWPVNTNLAATIGLVLVLVPVFRFQETTPYPGKNALMPVLGTMLLLACATPATWVGRFLSLRLMVWIGTISYGAYLWHQPLFAFARLMNANAQPLWLFGLLAGLTLVLAELSRRYVEAPFRDRRRTSRRLIFSCSLGVSLVFVGVGSAIALTHGVPGRWSAGQRALLMPAKTQIRECPSLNPWLQVCTIGAAGKRPTIALIGDSHADALATALGEAFARGGLAGYVVHTPCHPIGGYFDSRESVTASRTAFCAEADRRLLAFVGQPGVSNVIVAIRWIARLYPIGHAIAAPHYDNGEGGIERDLPYRKNLAVDERGELTEDAGVKSRVFLAYLDALAKLKPTILVYPVPEVGWLPARINLIALAREHQIPKYISTSWTRMKQRNAPAVQLLDSVESVGLRRVYPERLFCNTVLQQRCVVQDDGRLYYADASHLSMEGARLVVAQIMAQLAVPPLKIDDPQSAR